MRKLLLGFIIVFALKGKAQTNKYHPFPDSNAVWCDSMTWNSASARSTTITGDTVISGKTYHKLVSNSIYYEQGPFPGDVDYQYITSSNSSYSGAIRQDTMLRQVYLLSPSATNEIVLYDFSLHVGDTLGNFSIVVGSTTSATITTIDSVLIGTSYRKRWVVNQSGAVLNGYIIEGIGSTSGLFDYLTNEEYPNAPIDYLTCFSQNNKKYYPYYSTTGSCQQINISGIQQLANNNELNIYPNPNNGSFVIEPQNTLYNVHCTVYDVNGKLVLSQTINGKTSIDAGSLNEGVYNISLQSNEGVVNKRLVIVR
jgi:hypothetical protein